LDAFFWPLLVAPAVELRLVQVAISLSVEEHRTIWNQLLAGSMLAAVVPILLLLPFQQYYVRGIVGTGVKEKPTSSLFIFWEPGYRLKCSFKLQRHSIRSFRHIAASPI
jgi:hypothetical protein